MTTAPAAKKKPKARAPAKKAAARTTTTAKTTAKTKAKAGGGRLIATRTAAETIRTLAGVSTAAVARATGHGWSYWLKALDRAGAATLPHGEIVALLSKSLGLKHPWWLQMITVGYEQARGLRKPGQRTSGFAATVTRTIGVPLNALYDAWQKGRRGDWLPDAIEVRRATRNKSMKITWPDGSGVDVNFYDKGGNKAVIAVEQTKLPDESAVDAAKTLWNSTLDRLKATLEGKR
jgi:hypothetical protein